MPTAEGQLTAAEIAAIAALIQAQAQARAELTRLAIRASTLPLRTFSAWWDADAIRAYITEVLRVVRPAQVRMARTTDAYVARVLSIMTGRRVPPVGAIDTSGLRRAITAEMAEAIVDALPPDYDFAPSQPAATPSTRAEPAGTTPSPSRPVTTRPSTSPRRQAAETVDPAQVYGRIFDSARFHIVAKGYTPEQVQAKSIQRAAAVAQTDIMLADRAQARHTMRQRGVQRYRRVIRPYAGSGGPVCGLCIVASTRIYFIEDLLPIHNNCRCTVVPVGDAADPGEQFNKDDLRALYRAAGSTGGSKRQGGALKKVRVQITEHGELGPILVNGAHKRRGPAEVAAATHPGREVTARAQLNSYLQSLPILQAREAAGEDVLDAIRWQTRKIAELRRELGDA